MGCDTLLKCSEISTKPVQWVAHKVLVIIYVNKEMIVIGFLYQIA